MAFRSRMRTALQSFERWGGRGMGIFNKKQPAATGVASLPSIAVKGSRRDTSFH